MNKQAKRKRSERIVICVLLSEKKTIHALALKHGMSDSAYAKRRLLYENPDNA